MMAAVWNSPLCGRWMPRRAPIHSLLALAFWVGLLVPILVYVGYPVSLLVLARIRPARELDLVAPWPSVTVTIAAHDEELDIARAVRSVLAQDYPGPPITVLVGLDGCTDGTRAVLDGLAEPSVSYLDLPRGGKAATDNELVAAAAGDVVVTTAAGSIFAEGSLRRLVEPFRDQRVGCTTGIFAPRQDGSTAAGGEGLYWRFEYGLMAAESRLGLLVAASGTCMAHRRAIFQPIPLDSDGDVAIAPNSALQGAWVVFVAEAVAYDDGPPNLEAVLRNRRRMALRALPTTITFIGRMLGRRRFGPAAALVLHKLLRWLVPFFVVLWAIASVGLVATGDGFYTALALIVVVAAVVGAALTVVAGSRRRGAVVSFALAQLAFALATIDAIRGRRARMWTRT